MDCDRKQETKQHSCWLWNNGSNLPTSLVTEPDRCCLTSRVQCHLTACLGWFICPFSVRDILINRLKSPFPSSPGDSWWCTENQSGVWPFDLWEGKCFLPPFIQTLRQPDYRLWAAGFRTLISPLAHYGSDHMIWNWTWSESDITSWSGFMYICICQSLNSI